MSEINEVHMSLIHILLMDKDKAMKTIQEYGAEAVIIDEDKNVYVSEGLKDRFTITAEDYKLAE